MPLSILNQILQIQICKGIIGVPLGGLEFEKSPFHVETTIRKILLSRGSVTLNEQLIES